MKLPSVLLIYTAIILISSFNYTLGQGTTEPLSPLGTSYIQIKFKKKVEYSYGLFPMIAQKIKMNIEPPYQLLLSEQIL